MMLFVPGVPGHYFDRNLILFGVVPRIIGGALLASVGVLSAKWQVPHALRARLVNTISLGVARVVLFYIVMGLFSKFQT